MSKKTKLFNKIMDARSDANIPFVELCTLLISLGFERRQKGGSHHVFSKTGIEELLNLQPVGSKAKPYQVDQVRGIIKKYRLSL